MQAEFELYVVDGGAGVDGLGVEVLPEGSAPTNSFSTISSFSSTTCPTSTFGTATTGTSLSCDMKAQG